MKIKLRTLNTLFPGITGIYDSIHKFARVIDLSPAYKEIKNVVELFEEKRKNLLPTTDEDGNMSVKDYTAFEKAVNAILDEEISLKNNLKFSVEEAKSALEAKAIKSSQFVALQDIFIAKATETEPK